MTNETNNVINTRKQQKTEAKNKRIKRRKNRLKTIKMLPSVWCRRHFRTSGVYAPEDKDNLKMHMILVSDLHTDGDYYRDRTDILRRLFAGISDTKYVPDAMLIPGDLTNSAHQCEYDNLEKLLKKYNRISRILPVIGNHDYRATDMEPIFAVGKELFCKYAATCGVGGLATYYSTKVSGYPVITLGADDDFYQDNRKNLPWFEGKNLTDRQILTNMAWISDDQISFLDKELTKLQSQNLPVIVCCHHPLNDIPGVLPEGSFDGGMMGPQSDAVKAVLREHTDAGMTILYVFGHLHNHPTKLGLQQLSKGLYALEVPSAEYTDGGGWGYSLEMYDNAIRLRCRNFITNRWMPEADYTIPLNPNRN